MRSHKEFLQQFMKGVPAEELEPAPREFAAGVPLEAARALLLGQEGSESRQPWQGLPSHVACLAVASRLFAALLPEQGQQGACERLCAAAVSSDAGIDATTPSSAAVFEAAAAWQLSSTAASRPTDSLEAMVRNEPVAVCVPLDDYVAVLENPETGEEVEEEVGKHCIMFVGGDLSVP